jgi:hypothetical protein
MDSFRVANPLTHDLALKAASLVLEFAAQDSLAILEVGNAKGCAASGDEGCCLGA